MVCVILLRGPCKRQGGLGNARSKMSMSPSWAPALPLCKGPHLFSSTNPIKALAIHIAPLAVLAWRFLSQCLCLRPLQQRLFYLRSPGRRSVTLLACFADETQVAGCGFRLPWLTHDSQGVGHSRLSFAFVTGEYCQLKSCRVVPVIGLASSDAAFDGVRHYWQQLLLAWIRLIAQLHQSDRVDAWIRVTPISFKTTHVRVNRFVEQATREVVQARVF